MQRSARHANAYISLSVCALHGTRISAPLYTLFVSAGRRGGGHAPAAVSDAVLRSAILPLLLGAHSVHTPSSALAGAIPATVVKKKTNNNNNGLNGVTEENNIKK